jgi:alpha-galactosidase
MKDYEVLIRIDRRPLKVESALDEAEKWWSELGFKSAPVPEHATLPMYSCWYSFHQRTIPDEIVAECERAKALGMDTVIVDDGWQTDDNSRGYAFCGDWQIAKSKIPDMKDFVDRVHAPGMKFMIWFSVPFVGFSSKNFERFKGKYLYTNKRLNACVLDPRFKEVREFLVDTYVSYVKEYGWDGLKLDFIDSFRLDEESSTDYDAMDYISVEQAVEALLCETYEALTKINPDILIEYRQSYIGPVVGQYGNMFRVTDCPGDPLLNKTHSLDLRMNSGDRAIHSDMLVFNENDTLEGVAYQLYAIMFCVPQISVLLDKISAEQRALVTHYLAFWREHRKTLLSGKLDVRGHDVGYTMAQSTKDGECVAVLYHNVSYSAQKDVTTYLFNSSGYDGVIVELEADAECEIYDILGNKYASKKLTKGIHKIPAKNCEMIKLS